MSSIRFVNIKKEFAGMDRPALNGVNLAVESGQLVVLLGPSGCGKTTLVKLVNRLYEPTAGDILIDDQSIYNGINIIELRRKIGYVIQQTGLFPHLTAAQNISIVPALLKWPEEKIDRRIDELMNMVALPPNEYRERYPAQMSGGQQQRVGVARALAGDPGVILMDEPFGALDAITRTDLQDSLLSLQHHLRKTILFVTHDVDEAIRLADRIAILQDGNIVQFGPPQKILSQPNNEFVSKLVGSGDIGRQLGLIHIADVMKPDLNNLPIKQTIDQDKSLREALSELVNSKHDYLTVVNTSEQPVGTISFEDIRSSVG